MVIQGFFETVREFIGGIAFAVYLWSVRMTPDEFWDEQEKAAQQSVRRIGLYCAACGSELGENDTCPRMCSQDTPNR